MEDLHENTTKYAILPLSYRKAAEILTLAVSALFERTLTISVNGPEKSITLLLKKPSDIIQTFDSIDALRAVYPTDENHLVVEFDSRTGQVNAFHDAYFALTTTGEYYRAAVDQLSLHPFVKYKDEQEINLKRLMDSLGYGLLKEFADNNAANPDMWKRGVQLADSLYTQPPKELYRLKKERGQVTAVLTQVFNHYNGLAENDRARRCLLQAIRGEAFDPTMLPRINVNTVDFIELAYAQAKYGSFEVYGSTIDGMEVLVTPLFETCSEIMQLPPEALRKIANNKDEVQFHGLQDVRAQMKAEGKPERFQRAFHWKPHAEEKYPRKPDGINMNFYNQFYARGEAHSHVWFRQLAIHDRVPHDRFPNYQDDKISVTTTREYVPGGLAIPAHEDHGYDTTLASNKKGLEIKKGEQWIPAPPLNGDRYRFYKNKGNCSRFLAQYAEAGYPLIEGTHRVPFVTEKRNVVAFFHNPDPKQQFRAPNGDIVTFQEWLNDRDKYKAPGLNK